MVFVFLKKVTHRGKQAESEDTLFTNCSHVPGLYVEGVHGFVAWDARSFVGSNGVCTFKKCDA